MVKMFEGSSVEQDMNAQPRQPQTPEEWAAALQEAQQFVELFRQQRDKMGSVANDLQAALSLCQHKLKQSEEELAKWRPEANSGTTSFLNERNAAE
jgi:hypothetical protein